MFADHAKIFIKSGKGGDGHVSFRRELFVPNGGPDGGDGGRGGDIIFEVDKGLNTLNDFRHVRKYVARAGEEGGKRRCHGADAEDLIIKVPEGPIIRIDYKGEANDTSINSDANFFDYPMVVLCNQYTASAGELFSSALQDYAVAKLVGVQTYGKGTMQTVLSLPSGGGISVTCAYYLPPKSPNYHGVGVKPDLVVELPEELRNLNVHKLTAEQDTQMQAAVVTLIEEMARREKPDGIVT